MSGESSDGEYVHIPRDAFCDDLSRLRQLVAKLSITTVCDVSASLVAHDLSAVIEKIAAYGKR